MKSRITIEVNFDENNLPVIQVLSQNSDDVRDKLISSFLQSLQHTSRWCKIIYMGNRSPLRPPDDFYDAIHCWHIVPITPTQIPEEVKLMKTLFNDRTTEGVNIRNRMDLWKPAELAIHNAVQEIEKMGADTRLTHAQLLLQEARDLVADFIIEKEK